MKILIKITGEGIYEDKIVSKSVGAKEALEMDWNKEISDAIIDGLYSDPITQEDIDFAEQCENDKWEEYNRDKGV